MARYYVGLLLAAVLACFALSTRAGNADRAQPGDVYGARPSQLLSINVPLTPRSLDLNDNLCAAFGWQGAVDTDLRFKEFFQTNHTVAARFMLQYPRSYQAPILAAKGAGDYLVAVAGYGEGRVKAERLVVSVGGATRYYTVGGKLPVERWHWLALVRESAKLRLYLNGKELKPDNDDAAIGANAPEGTLRLGRKASGDAQFYGLMDDVAVFDSALDPKTLKSYYDERPRLSGTEQGLVAAYLFDQQAESSIGAPAARPVFLTTKATRSSMA